MDRINIRERGISLFVSLLFHVAVLFLLIEVVPSVRMHLYRQVADVRLVSPERIYFPRIEVLTEEIPASEVLSQSLPNEESFAPGEEDLSQVESPEPGVLYLRNMAFGQKTERRDYSGAIPKLKLVPSPKTERGFSLGIDPKQPESEEMVDFSEYIPPALSSLRFNRIVNRKGGIPSRQISQNVLGQQEGYDIAPWVKGVVDKIRNNWTLPPIDESIAIGEVKIHVIFSKKGELVSMKIVEASDFRAFDRTAIGAIRSGVPFPPLPDDFPSDRLEAYLLFQFNE